MVNLGFKWVVLFVLSIFSLVVFEASGLVLFLVYMGFRSL